MCHFVRPIGEDSNEDSIPCMALLLCASASSMSSGHLTFYLVKVVSRTSIHRSLVAIFRERCPSPTSKSPDNVGGPFSLNPRLGLRLVDTQRLYSTHSFRQPSDAWEVSDTFDAVVAVCATARLADPLVEGP